MPSGDVTVADRSTDVCLSGGEYYGLIASLVIVLILLLVGALVAGICFRYRLLRSKNDLADATAPASAAPVYSRSRNTTAVDRNFAFINRAFEPRYFSRL